MTVQETIIKARTSLLLERPFYGSILMRMELVEDTTCDTMWIDGKSIGFNPDFIDSLTFSEVKGLLAHEALHIALCHHTRRNNRDPKEWNEACDFPINEVLTEAGMSLPAGGCLDSKFYGLSAEQVFAKRSAGKQQQQQQQQGQGQGQPQQGQDDPQQPNEAGEVRDYPSEDGQGEPTPDEIAQEEQDVKIMISQAAQAERMAGSMTGGLDRVVTETIYPKVDWKDTLRDYIEQATQSDFSWSKPNRRYLSQGLFLPSLHSMDELGHVVIAIDTSCSVSASELDSFAAEVSGILESYNVEVTVIYCDDHIHRDGVEHFSSEDLPVKLSPKGGGGTRFEPVFNYVDDKELEPVCLIYMSDLEGSFRFPEPDYPVLWVDTWGGSTAPWGETIALH